MILEKWSAPDLGLSQANIGLWNAAMSHAGRMIPVAQGKYGLSFTLLEEPPADGRVRRLLLGKKDFGYARVEAFPFQSYCGVDLDVSDLDNVPAELATALNDGMLMAVLSALPNDLGTRLLPGPALELTILLSKPKAKYLQWFSATLVGLAEDPVQFTFAVTADVLCSELAGRGLSARQVDTALGEFITTPVSRLVGSAVLLLPELYGLAPGDCVLFTETADETGCAVLVDDRVFMFTANEDGWACDQVLPFASLVEINKPGACAMEDGILTLPDPNPGEDARDDIKEQLEVTVTFCLGSARLPISEIESWNAGAVVGLPEEISAEETLVTVSANGLAVAQGDLVRIDDRLAVRLNRILLTPSHPGE